MYYLSKSVGINGPRWHFNGIKFKTEDEALQYIAHFYDKR